MCKTDPIAKKPAFLKATEIEQTRGGFHLFELHLPTAGLSALTILLFLLTLFIAFLLYRRFATRWQTAVARHAFSPSNSHQLSRPEPESFRLTEPLPAWAQYQNFLVNPAYAPRSNWPGWRGPAGFVGRDDAPTHAIYGRQSRFRDVTASERSRSPNRLTSNTTPPSAPRDRPSDDTDTEENPEPAWNRVRPSRPPTQL